MIGLEAISANNGWAMAITGIVIVMSGLAILSYIISQLHKIIGIFEKKTEAVPEIMEPRPKIDILNNLDAVALEYQLLTVDLGENFPLVKLYEVIEKEDLPHPHLTINALRERGNLVALGDGLFSWNQE